MVLLISVIVSLTYPGETADAINLSPPDASPPSSLSDFRISMDSSGTGNTNLQYEFYREKCPQAEKIVRSTMAQLFTRNKNATAEILRLLFHDCSIEVIENFPDAKNVTEELALVVSSSRLQKFWNSSAYYLKDEGPKNPFKWRELLSELLSIAVHSQIFARIVGREAKVGAIYANSSSMQQASKSR